MTPRPARTYPLPQPWQGERQLPLYATYRQTLGRLAVGESLLMPRHLTARSCYNYAWFVGQALGRRFAVRVWAPGRYRIWRTE